MTEKLQFLADKIASLGLAWWVTPEGKIRTRRALLDPLGALYICSSGRKTLRLSDFESQGLHLGLSREETLALVRASDNSPGHDSPLRRLLLEKLTPP